MDRRWGFATDKGHRDDNQDCTGVFQFGDVVVAVVCDGMGGHQGGAYASAMGVKTVHDALGELLRAGSKPRDALIEAARRANTAIFEASRRSHRLAGMGTTIAAVLIDGDLAHIVHVGDSRVYLVRNGEAKSLTRDHTMVNLFVEAELLSPEDAASHPEAHVLSRSLGVERQVEVEAQAPFTIEYADAFVLCTDGIHGVINDWELSKVEWADPTEGVVEALRLVSARDGDDNASVVAVISGEFEGDPSVPSPVPQLEDISDPASAYEPEAPMPPAPRPAPAPGNQLAQRVDTPAFVDIPNTPPPAPMREPAKAATPTPAAARNSIDRAPSDAPGAIPHVPDKPGTAGGRLPNRKEKEKDKPKRATPRAMVAVAAVVAAIAIIGLGGGVYIARNRPSPALLAQVDPSVTPPVETPPVETPPVETPPEPATAPIAIAPPLDIPLFKPELPAQERRAPHHGTKYGANSPGGTAQLDAVTAARAKDCERSFTVVRDAMANSIDYGPLYMQSWKCFNDEDQAPLLAATATSPAEFEPLVAHFEGDPEPVLPGVAKPPPSTLPAWYAPARGGLEFRFEQFEDSGDKDLFSDVMIDRLGEQTVADHLLADMWLEVTAARGLAALPTQDDQTIAWWARRVFIVRKYMNGSIGELLRQQRPEAVAQIEEMLKDATRSVDPALFSQVPPLTPEQVPLPAPVWQAWGVALGKLPTPDSLPVTSPKVDHSHDDHYKHRDVPPVTLPPKKEKIKVFGG